MSISLVDILNTGVTEFAYVMLYLGYKLTSDVQSKIFDKKVDEFPSVELYRKWKSLVCSQFNNSRYFLAFSLIFFASALFLLMYQAESEIVLSVAPLDAGYAPVVHHQSEQLTLSDTGRAIVKVKDERNVYVSTDKLVKRLHELTFSVEDQKNTAKKLLLLNSNNAADAGF